MKNLELLNKTNKFGSSLLSFGAYSNLSQAENFLTYGGFQSDLNSKAVQYFSLLIGASYKNFNGALNLVTEKLSEEIELEKVYDKAVVGERTCSYKNSMNLNVESKVNEDLAVYSSAELASNLCETEVTVGGVYSVDNSTSLRLKLKNDFSGVIALTRAYNKNVQLTFASAFNYVSPKSESSFGHLATKFGLSVSLAEEEN